VLTPWQAIAPLAFIVPLFVLAASVLILRKYERAKVFTVDRFERVKGRGLALLAPAVTKRPLPMAAPAPIVEVV